MYMVKDVADLLKGLKQSKEQAVRRRDNPDNRVKDTTFYRGEVYGLEHAIELVEALVRSQDG